MKPFFYLFFLVTCLAGIGQPRLVKHEITEAISLLVPENLQRTPPVLQRSTSETLANFNSRDGQADLGINQAQLKWASDDLDLLNQFYKANILNLYDEVKMHEEGIKTIDGKKFLVFEFSGTLLDEGNAFAAPTSKSDYTYIMYHVNASGVLIFRFTSPMKQRSTWQKSVKEMMESVTIKTPKK